MNKFLSLITTAAAMMSLCATYANDGKISLRLVKNVVIKQSLAGENKNQIYTVRRGQRFDRDIFRSPPGSTNGAPEWTSRPLVYVQPGGLEPNTGDYLLPFDSQLGDKYKDATFSFSGPANSLAYVNGFGWGTENNNGDFTPYLVQSNYEEIKEPSFEFFWQNKKKYDQGGGHINETTDNITLNYLFKVPKQPKIQWGTELSFSRFSFGGGSSTNTPKVKSNDIFRWDNGFFQTYSTSLTFPDPINKWKLPYGIKMTSFAVPEDGNVIYTADSEGKIAAYDSSGKKLWTTNGRAPVIIYKNNLLTMSANYQNIQCLDAKTGKASGLFPVPRFLPRSLNSFALATFTHGSCLFLQIPEQSRILCYKIED